MKKPNKKKRFYHKDEIVWIIPLKKEGLVRNVDLDNLKMTVEYTDVDMQKVKYVGDLWEFDKLKYSAKEKIDKNSHKISYFASVNGGVIPTKDEENAGRDCYARLEPQIVDGKEIYELYIPQFTLAKIPLGFASYLNKDDFLSLKHERSSVGSTGLINVSGLIDSTYQGEVILQVIPVTNNVLITNRVSEKRYNKETNTYLVPYNKAICQAVIMEQSKAKDIHVTYDELLEKPSSRGIGGWGSTNK